MAENDDIVNRETHHEKSDVDVRALLWSVGIFIVFGFVTHFALYMMFQFYRGLFQGATNAPLTSIARPADAAIPQEPRLQPFPNRDKEGVQMRPNTLTPQVDMVQMRQTEDEALQNAGWIDKQKGTVRIPIDVAKKLVVQRGLPVVAK